MIVDNEGLAQQFEANRSHLRAVACRMLSSLSEADDAVQETWFRLSRSDTSGVENLGASREVRGAEAVASMALSYSRLDLFMRPALVNGAAGLVATFDGQPFSVGGFAIRGGKIVEIDILADPVRLAKLDLTILDD